MSLRPAHIIRTHRRFKVAAPPENFRDAYVAALDENAFREPLSATSKEIRAGWCDAAQPLVTTFGDLNRWLFNQYAVLAVRVEQKRLPARRVKAEVQRRTAAWCAENNRERCPSKVKAEIKEAVEFELLQKVLPKMDVYPLIWNVAEGWLVINCTSETRLDLFRKLFHRTFGIALVPADPLDLAGDELGCKLLDVPGLDLSVGPGVAVAPICDAPAEDAGGDDEGDDGERSAILDEERQCPPHITSEFALWLWWRSAEGRGSLDLGDHGALDFHLDGRVDFRRPGEDKTIASVGGETPERDPVALAALASGAVVKSFGLALRREDREYTLRLSGPVLHKSGLKIPALVKSGDDAEQVYETTFLLEECEWALSALFTAFAEERTGSRWSGKQGIASAIRRWIGADLATRLGETFGVDEGTGQVRLFSRAA